MFCYAWWRVEGVTKCDRMERSISVTGGNGKASVFRSFLVFLSLGENILLPSGQEGGHLSHESFMTCFREGQGVLLHLLIFQCSWLKIFSMPRCLFWGRLSWILYYKHLRKFWYFPVEVKNSPSLNLGIPFFSPRDKGSHWGKHKVCLYCKFKFYYGEFPGGPVTKTVSPNADGLGLILIREQDPTRHNLRVHKLQLRPGAAKYIFQTKSWHFQTYIIK